MSNEATARNFKSIEELKERVDSLSKALITDHDSLMEARSRLFALELEVVAARTSLGERQKGRKPAHEAAEDLRQFVSSLHYRMNEEKSVPAVLSNDGPAAVDAYQRGFHDALQLQRDGKILVVIDSRNIAEEEGAQ